MVKLLVENRTDVSAKHNDAVALILDSGASIDRYGSTALHPTAAEKGHGHVVVAMLLDRGASNCYYYKILPQIRR